MDLLRNWELKLLALLAAVGLWLFVVSGEKSELAVAAPIEFVNVPSGLVLTGPVPDTVGVQVRGLRSSLAVLSARDLRAEVSLTSASAGDMSVGLEPENVRVPRGVVVTRVSPSRLQLHLEPVTTAWMRVVPQVVGGPAEGFRVGAVTVQPPLVEVRGPRSVLARRAEMTTAPIDVSDLRRQVKRSAALAPPSEAVQLGAVQTVDVTVEIVEDVMHGKKARGR